MLRGRSSSKDLLSNSAKNLVLVLFGMACSANAPSKRYAFFMSVSESVSMIEALSFIFSKASFPLSVKM